VKRVWEYHVEVIPIERWDGNSSTWSVLNSPHGQTKLTDKLNEFGNFGWNLVSVLPVLTEEGNPVLPPTIYATFKRIKE